MRESHKILAARVGAGLKKARGSMTQAEFAGEMGLRQSQYSRYETGERLAPDHVLIKAAGLTGLGPEELALGAEPGPGAPGQEKGGLAMAVADLMNMLAPRDREDIYLFIKAKVKDRNRRSLTALGRLKKILAAGGQE